MKWQDIVKENIKKEDANTFIEMLEGLMDKIRSIEEELPLDIMYVVEQIQESKFGDIEDIKSANSDLDIASGDPVNAEGEILALIRILQRYD